MKTNNSKPLVWSRGKLKNIPYCPACQSNKRDANFYERRDNDLFMPDIWRYIQCSNCKTLWLEQRPDELSLPKAYDNYYTHEEDRENIDNQQKTSLLWKLINGYLNSKFKMQYKSAYPIGYIIFSLIEPLRLKLDYYCRHLTTKNVGHPGKLLDIGCGNGSFLQRANAMGWEALGCEIDPKAIRTCRKLNLDVVHGDAFHPELQPNSYDVITLSHVIEHVADQKALLKRIYELLKPNGTLWLAYPNPQSLGLKISKTAWHALHPPFHLIMPSHTIMKSYLSDTGYYNINFLRRGSHVNNVWELSANIANNECISHPKPLIFKILKIITNIASTLSSSYADEIIILAKKPKE